MKAKLVRQVLVQKERDLFRCLTWEKNGFSTQRPSPLSAQAQGSHTGREGRAFYLSNYVVSFQCTGALSFIFLALVCSCEKLPLHHLRWWGRHPGAPWLSTATVLPDRRWRLWKVIQRWRISVKSWIWPKFLGDKALSLIMLKSFDFRKYSYLKTFAFQCPDRLHELRC